MTSHHVGSGAPVPETPVATVIAGDASGDTSEDVAFLRAVGRRVRTLRVSRDWNQEQLARRSGLSRNFLSLLERGHSSIDVLRLHHLATALDTDLCTLLHGHWPPHAGHWPPPHTPQPPPAPAALPAGLLPRPTLASYLRQVTQ